jgi:two-component system cell cycle response regulator DivK
MAGEPILVVDDTPVNLKLTRVLLVNEGYKVLTAASAEEAIELLRSFRPDLVLADIQLPGMDGLELTRRIKQDENTRDIAVVALTAFATKGDQQKAIDAGCDGYITKPIDTRLLGSRIRAFLDRRVELRFGPASPRVADDNPAIPRGELQSLRARFLEEGREQARQWLLDLDGQFNAAEASRVVHQWIGAAGLLGYNGISRLAREAEATLGERPVDQNQLRDSLTNLALAFSSPQDARDVAIPESIVQALAGKRIALVGLPANQSQRLVVALDRAQALTIFFTHTERPDMAEAQACQAVVVFVGPEGGASPWLDAASPAYRTRPLVLVGNREHLVELEPKVQSMASEFLMDSWQPEEALVRISHAFSERRTGASSAGVQQNAKAPARPVVVLADDDPTVLTLVGAAIQNYGMDCHTAPDGPGAIAAIRRIQPQVAVLDVNMPGMDGYEVLAAVRAEGMPVQVLLLTARQQETDVLRGFRLGADDYVVKPFSPMELMARLKRLLWR